MLDHEVADPDRADLAVGEQRLQRAVGLQGPVERRRQRLVQDQQVDLLDAELAGALLEAVQRLVVSVVADPDLGLQEHLERSRLGAVDRLADLALVAVGRGGVDVPVPGVERGADGVAGLVGGRLEDAEAEGGHLRRRCSVSRIGVVVAVMVGSFSLGHRGCRAFSACAVGRTRISLSDTLRGRETAKAMISAMSCGAIDVCLVHLLGGRLGLARG